MENADELAGWVELDGCFNFRDLGGYRSGDGRRVRTGQLFRADGLQHLSAADLSRLCDEIGLGSVIDLRSSEEIEQDGRGAIADRTTVHHVPLFDETRSRSGRAQLPPELLANMGELYYLMLNAAREPIARVVQLIAEAETPTVFHCAAGKDRTGLISALLLSLLDVPEDTIVADYAFSRQNIDQINARLSASKSYQRLMDALPPDAYDANPTAMRGFLDRVRQEHGSMTGWAETAGLGPGLRDRLRGLLLV